MIKGMPLSAQCVHATTAPSLYNQAVRRLLAISLLLLFNLPAVSPLFALAATSDANLPACCRRNGAHHCAMQMGPTATSNGPAFSSVPEKCPAYPRPATLVRITHAQIHAGTFAFATPAAVASVTQRAETRSKAAIKSPHQKRGPPTQQACFPS